MGYKVKEKPKTKRPQKPPSQGEKGDSVDDCKYCGEKVSRHTCAILIVTHITIGVRKYEGCVWCLDEIRNEYNNR